MDYQKPKFISAGEIREFKKDATVEESYGVRSCEVTAVLPTYNRGTHKYISTLSNILRKLGHQVDKGVVDEVLIIDGSTKDGEIDRNFLQRMMNIFSQHCETFQKEMEYIESLPSVEQRATSGRYEFCYKVVHQMDSILSNILKNQGLFDRIDEEELKRGKGSALWLSVPASRGDVIAFLDSDIQSFEEYYVTDLIHPILEGGQDFEGYGSEVLFCKASYLRQHNQGDRYSLGGRLARLAIGPLFELLREEFDINGLGEIEYPLSGEMAFHREALNHLQFSNGYDIEVSMLFQFLETYGKERMKQPNFGFYQHLPGSETHVEKMLHGITEGIRYWLVQDKEQEIDEVVDKIERCLNNYKGHAEKKLDHYKEIGKQYSNRVTYTEDDAEEDKDRIETYDSILKEEMRKNQPELDLLPKWGEIKSALNQKRGYSYSALRRAMSRRVNIFTAEMISEI